MSAMKQHSPKTPRKAALASFLGSTVEYYDFFIYGTASALIFGKVFFPSESATTATLLSFATFGVAYVARPIGAIFLGHFGDRLGRQKLLVFTLVLMGVATMGIGLMPSYGEVGSIGGYGNIGITAQVLLVLMRVLQGLSAAGEQAGASAMTLEHSPEGKRAFYTSFTLSGTQAGQILAMLVFIPVTTMPEAAMLQWGWRIPFLLSAVVVLVAFLVRRTLHEPPEFAEARNAGEVERFPVIVLFKNHTRDVIRVICCALIAVVSTVFGTLAINYATKPLADGGAVGLAKSDTLWVLIVGNVLALITQPLWALVADRIGRKPVFIFGALGSGCSIFAFFAALSSGNWLAIYLTAILTFSLCYAAANAVWPSFYSEMFDTKVRYSGVAISTQIGFMFAGFAPAIGAAIEGKGTQGWVPIAVMTLIGAVISASAALTAKESHKITSTSLGSKGAAAKANVPEPQLSTSMK